MNLSGHVEIPVISNGRMQLDMTDPETISLEISNLSQHAIIRMTREQAHELETALKEEREHEEHKAHMIRMLVEEAKKECHD